MAPQTKVYVVGVGMTKVLYTFKLYNKTLSSYLKLYDTNV